MKLSSFSFIEGGPIPGEFAFAVTHPNHHIALGQNRNPHLAWSDVPKGTQSLALICHDADVPSRADDVNKDDRQIPASLRRVMFFHWLLLDIPATVREIEAGSHSNQISPRGKPGPLAPHGLRHGINDYTSWFSGDESMRGEYYGYDGPCPPWNDTLIHHYVFTLYALDVAHLAVPGTLSGTNVIAALAGHVLAKATLSGTYSLNPTVR